MSDSTLTTADVARLLDTTPKILRQFLRSREAGVGSGARYQLTQADVAALSTDFERWMSAREAGRVAKHNASVITDAPGLNLRTATPDDIRELTTARVDRLEELLKSKGLHISQMRDREGWRPVGASAE